MEGINKDRAPGIDVVVPYFLLAAVAFLFLSVGLLYYSELLLGHYYQSKILALTHLIVLGWISMIIMGALYQLVPVVFESSLYSEQMAKVNLYIYSAGVIGLVYAFWVGNFNEILSGFSIVLFIAIILFGLNILLSVYKAKVSNFSAKFIISAMIWLLLTASMGILLALNHQFNLFENKFPNYIKIHAHLGILGWFLQLIIGVSSVLFPMFLVSHELNESKLKRAFYLINIGLIFLVFKWFFPIFINGIDVLFTLIIIIGIGFYISYLIDAYRKKLRKLDIGMLLSTVSIINISVPIILIICFIYLSFIKESIDPALFNIYGFSIFIVFITPLILGQTYKTLPFVLWLHHYQKFVGKKKIVMPGALFNQKIALIHMWTFIIAILLMLIGMIFINTIVLRIGILFLLLTSLLYLFNIIKIIFHKPIIGVLDSLDPSVDLNIMEVLKGVIDPEVEINIVDLGLIYKVSFENDQKINIEMTLSTPSCPVGDSIVMNIMEVVQSAFPDLEVNVHLTFEPKWNPSMISPIGKKSLNKSHAWFEE